MDGHGRARGGNKVRSCHTIYSSITKVVLQGGKNYSVHGALSYTIVSDIALIAATLPRVPNIVEVAIMRNENGRVSRDYTYRPYYARLALLYIGYLQL